MPTKPSQSNKAQTIQKIFDIGAGDIVRVHQKISTEGEKNSKKGQKIQVFEGLIIARKHGKEPGGTFTIRKISDGIGVERIFPIFCPTITKIEVIKRSKVRRAKLYYMRERQGKKAKMKTKRLLGVEWKPTGEETPKPSQEILKTDEAEVKKETPKPSEEILKTPEPEVKN